MMKRRKRIIRMKALTEDINTGNFRPVYLLYGQESYLRTMYRDKLLKALLPEPDGMNFTRYEEKNAVPDQIIAQAETLPFFSDRRVILLENTGMFKAKNDQMADYLASLPDYLVLIFNEDEIDKRNRLYKSVQKYGRAVEFSPQPADVLIRWILGKLKKEGKKITRENIEHFLTVTGTDMANISSELEKLLSYTLGQNVISREDIDAVCVTQTSNRIFDMVQAVTEHRQKEALDCYYDLLALKEPPMRILYLLARQYNQLLLVLTMQRDGLASREIAAKAGVPPFVIKKSISLCRRFSEQQLRQAVEKCTSAETAVKTGHLNDELSVELLITELSR